MFRARFRAQLAHDNQTNSFILLSIQKMAVQDFGFSAKRVFNTLIEVCETLDLNIEDQEEFHLEVSSGMGILSFGNVVSISVDTVGKRSCVVEVSSKSSAPIQLIDWGTNSDLEEQILSELSTNLEG